MILEEKTQLRQSKESSSEHLYSGTKKYYRFVRPIRPKKLIEDALDGADVISSYHTSRIHRDYYTVGLLLSPENKPTQQIKIELWSDGFAVYLDDSCPESYIPPLLEAIEKEVHIRQ